MKDEIKEILDSIRKIIKSNRENDFNRIIYDCDSMEKLLDYITNLQEENKGLHTRIKTIKRRRKAQTAKMRKYREEITNKQNSIVDYKSRNDKAIEYIKNTYKDFKNEDGSLPMTMHDQDLLNILQGEDKE